jgi:argininosuccinate lyase
LFGAVAAFEASLAVMAGLVATLSVDRTAMAEAAGDGYTTATTLADALVRRGVPFRAAHHVVGALVGQAERAGVRRLADLSPAALEDLLAASDDAAARDLAARSGIGADLLASATIEASLAAADVVGGTAPVRVAAAIVAARARLDAAAAASAVAGTTAGPRAAGRSPTGG